MEILTAATTVREAVKEVKAFEWEGDYRPAAGAARYASVYRKPLLARMAT